MKSKAESYNEYLSDSNEHYWWFPLYTFFGVVGSTILFLGYKKRLAKLTFIIGVCFIIFGGGAFVISGLYKS